MIRLLYTLLLLSFSLHLPGQISWSGQVQAQDGRPIFAANVYPKAAPAKGTITDFDGNFKLSLAASYDTLVISYIGYDTKTLDLQSLDAKQPLQIRLSRTAQSLALITIRGSDPIASQFSVVELEKMDIYLNPLAQGDPLKAITILPSSTTTDESANPSLRGSSADRSRVILNGVPIYQPVRSSQLNNQGFFSVFNPELIESMQVFASNPPLNYGNSSAGLVDIQSQKALAQDQFQLSTHLTGVGFFLSRRLKRDSSFVQLYSNLQFSEAFIGLNKANTPRLRGFHTRDMGLNLRLQLNDRWAINSFHYAIDEGYDFRAASLNFEALANAQTQRYFTVNNLYYNTLKGIASLNTGFNISNGHFTQANLSVNNNIAQFFTSLNYKHLAWRDVVLQVGLSFDYQQRRSRDSIPISFFAIEPDAPSFFQEQQLSLQQTEAYAFSSWDISRDWTLSAGLRVPIVTQPQQQYLSYQGALRHQLTDQQRLLFSAGQYNSFSTPSFFLPQYRLLGARQVAFEYAYEKEGRNLRAAIYAKTETGEQANNNLFSIDQLRTFGIEWSYGIEIAKHWQLALANTYIHQRMQVGERTFRGPRDFRYFFKGSAQYQNPKLFTLALTYLSQPGTPYTPITGSVFRESIGGYEPIFSNDLNNSRLAPYHRFDLNISRYFRFDRFSLVAFGSVANLFNQKNERDLLFAADFSSSTPDYFQLRTFFAGLVWQW